MSLAGTTIEVPGSTSNLGAGFDALGLALGLYLRLRIVACRAEEQGVCDWRFSGIDAPPDNYVERGYRAAEASTGRSGPGLTVEVSCEIPLRAGLGSSAAAIVAGIRLHECVTGHRRSMDELLTEAASLEGHPDNTSASLLGGFVVSAVTGSGRVAAIATEWPERVRVVVATPTIGLETKRARAVLPAAVPLADAVFNLQRAALLVQSVNRGDLRYLREATADRLHQPARAALVPGLIEALALDHSSLRGVFLSGAGPSVAALVEGDPEPVAGLLRAVYERLGLAVAVRALRVHPASVPTLSQRL
jgi:homoserine kinase